MINSRDLSLYFKDKKWNIKSTFGWQMLFGPILSIAAIAFFGKLLNEPSLKTSHNIWIGVGLIGIVGIGTLLYIISHTKTICFENDVIKIKYIFRNKTFSYPIDDVIGYSNKFNYASYLLGPDKLVKSDFSFQFKTADNKVYTLLDWEYSNFWELKTILKTRIGDKSIEIGRNQNWKNTLWILPLSILCIILIMWVEFRIR